mmetsp:Transcript_126722/g.270302  ORF Transcript_126722/g.270302 Transcript_126722/m.270302 type:complete len:188 (-) Transcript_126722:168-731(-)
MVRGGGAGALDTSFLPGPQKIPPHMAEQAWKNTIDREESFALARGPGVVPKGDMGKRNPITWETPSSSRLGTACSTRSGGGGADILSLEDMRRSRLGSAASMSSARSGLSQVSGSAVQRNGRLGTSRRLSSAGSFVSSAKSHLSSILSQQLEEERLQRQDAEREVAELKARLAERMRTPAAGSLAKE